MYIFMYMYIYIYSHIHIHIYIYKVKTEVPVKVEQEMTTTEFQPASEVEDEVAAEFAGETAWAQLAGEDEEGSQCEASTASSPDVGSEHGLQQLDKEEKAEEQFASSLEMWKAAESRWAALPAEQRHQLEGAYEQPRSWHDLGWQDWG